MTRLLKVKIHLMVLVFVSGLFVNLTGIAFGAAGMAVIVNKNNSYSASPKEVKSTVARLFLKKQSEWPDGEASRPFDRKGDSKEHTSFLKEVLGMNEAKLTQHWIKLKQLSGETPPRVIKPNQMIIKMVGRNKGGLAVVSASTAKKLPGNVKVLFTY